MCSIDRRRLLSALLGAAALPVLAIRLNAQTLGNRQSPEVFAYDHVVRQARRLATEPYAAPQARLPPSLRDAGYDAFRDVRFKPEKAVTFADNASFRLQLFHLGFLFQTPVIVNVIRDGVPAPIPYLPELFEFGAITFDKPARLDLGFAGFRLHHPLNHPHIYDELISFLGASYFRFLGGGQKYGLSARGLAIDVAGAEREEFPVFREFWIDPPRDGEPRVTVYGLLDAPSTTGAYRFVVTPGNETTIEATATLFPRRPLENVGLAPLTSMFFTGENSRRHTDDFRPELHDSDGLLLHTGSGEWVWRPLRNSPKVTTSTFLDRDPRGFGLLQRDALFANYQDLEARYHERPGYWVEPIGSWEEGQVELVEIPTDSETNDNIVAYWRPAQILQPGTEAVFSYRLRALGPQATAALHEVGRAINTFQSPTRASGSSAPSEMTSRRFLVDFAGGALAYHLKAPEAVQAAASTTAGKITYSSVTPNPEIGGFRAALDVQLQPGEEADLRLFLRSGHRALTETWTYPWRAQ